MNRRQAAQLLGLSESVTPLEANQAFLAKLNELDERIQTAPSEALRQKYQGMRAELLTALQVLTSGVGGDTRKPGSDVEDLPGAAPVRGPEAASSAAPALATSAPPPHTAESAIEKSPLRAARATRWIWLSASGAAAVALGVLAYTGVLGSAWESIRPMSAEERLAAFQDASRLEAEVSGFQERLEEVRRTTQNAVRDAQNEVRRIEVELRSARNDAERRNVEERLGLAKGALLHAERVLRLQEDKVFNNEGLIALRGKFTAATRLIDRRGDANLQATEELRPVREAYAHLIERLRVLEQRAHSQGSAEAAFTQWEEWSAGKNVSTESAAIRKLRTELSEVNGLESDAAAIARYDGLVASVRNVENDAKVRLTREAEERRRRAEVAAEAERRAQATEAAARAAELEKLRSSFLGTYSYWDGRGARCVVEITRSSGTDSSLWMRVESELLHAMGGRSRKLSGYVEVIGLSATLEGTLSAEEYRISREGSVVRDRTYQTPVSVSHLESGGIYLTPTIGLCSGLQRE